MCLFSGLSDLQLIKSTHVDSLDKEDKCRDLSISRFWCLCFVMEPIPPLIMKDDSAHRSEVNGLHGSFFFFKECWWTSMLFHTVAAPFYIYTNRTKGFNFLHTFTSNLYASLIMTKLIGWNNTYCGFDLWFPDE